MPIFVLDNMRHTEMCREWALMLPTAFEWVGLSEREPMHLVNDANQSLGLSEQDRPLLIIHRSAILNPEDQAWFRYEFEAPVLVVSGDPDKPQQPLNDLPETDRLYYMKNALGIYDAGFKRRLQVFWRKYQELGQIDWQLLEIPSTETLSAISILCQGYLCAYASAATTPPGSSLGKALAFMGHAGISVAMNNLSPVETLRGWNSVFGGCDLLARAEVEWGDEDEGWKCVAPFLARISQMTDAAPAIIEAEDVATAYCALAARLSGNSC